MFGRSTALIRSHQLQTIPARLFAKAVEKTEAVATKVAKEPKATKVTKAEKTPKTTEAPKAKAETTKAETVKATTKAPKVPNANTEKAPKKVAAATESKPTKPTKSTTIPKADIANVKVPKLKVRAGTETAPVSDSALKYAQRRDKFYQQMTLTQTKLQSLVEKPSYSVESAQRYETRIAALQIKYDRAHKLFKSANSKALSQQRLEKMPPRDELMAFPLTQRLDAICAVDTNLKTGYQLFARHLKIDQPTGLKFADYTDGWKALSESQKQPYLEAILKAKAAAKAAV